MSSVKLSWEIHIGISMVEHWASVSFMPTIGFLTLVNSIGIIQPSNSLKPFEFTEILWIAVSNNHSQLKWLCTFFKCWLVRDFYGLFDSTEKKNSDILTHIWYYCYCIMVIVWKNERLPMRPDIKNVDCKKAVED